MIRKNAHYIALVLGLAVLLNCGGDEKKLQVKVIKPLNKLGEHIESIRLGVFLVDNGPSLNQRAVEIIKLNNQILTESKKLLKKARAKDRMNKDFLAEAERLVDVYEAKVYSQAGNMAYQLKTGHLSEARDTAKELKTNFSDVLLPQLKALSKGLTARTQKK
jgi:hypothetical protein